VGPPLLQVSVPHPARHRELCSELVPVSDHVLSRAVAILFLYPSICVFDNLGDVSPEYDLVAGANGLTGLLSLSEVTTNYGCVVFQLSLTKMLPKCI